MDRNKTKTKKQMVSSTTQSITNSERNIIKSVLGDEHKVLASVVTRLYFAEKGSKQWKRIKEAGALNLTQSNGVFYFNLIDMETQSTEWNHEIYLDFKYNRDMEYFHSFEGDKGMFGILFVDVKEADSFYEILTTELETYTTKDKMPAKSKTRSKSIFGAFGFGRRSSKAEDSESANSEDKEPEKPKKKKEKPKDSDLTHDDVSEPRDFTHLSHIGFNPTKGTFDIENIPDEWKTTFAKAGITHDQLESRSTAKFIAGFVQDSEPQMKNLISKRPPAPVPLKKKAAPPPPPTPTRNKNATPLTSPKKSFPAKEGFKQTAVPPPPPPKKTSKKSNAANSSNGIPTPPSPPQTQSAQMPKPPSAHSALLDSIKGAGIGILKPVQTSNESSPESSSNPHSALMASIKGGASLRPASKIDRSPSSPTSSVASSDPTDMMAAMLAKALAARNKKLAADSSDDEDSDDSRW